MSDKFLPLARFRRLQRETRQTSSLDPSRLLPQWMPPISLAVQREQELVELVFDGIEAAWAYRSRTALEEQTPGLSDDELWWAMEIAAHPFATKAVHQELAILLVMATAH